MHAIISDANNVQQCFSALMGEERIGLEVLGQKPKENSNEDSGQWHWGLYTTYRLCYMRLAHVL